MRTDTPETPPRAPPPEPGWLSCWRAGPIPSQDALARFDALPSVEREAMIGRWRGIGLPTGHPLDSVLEALGWYGKAFDSVDRVHPLLFLTRSGEIVPLDPRFMPVSVALRWPTFASSAPIRMAFATGRFLLRAHNSAASLRAVTFREKRSASMIFHRKPIIDHLRKIDDDRVLGLMEMRGMELPYFFLLTRVPGLDAVG